MSRGLRRSIRRVRSSSIDALLHPTSNHLLAAVQRVFCLLQQCGPQGLQHWRPQMRGALVGEHFAARSFKLIDNCARANRTRTDGLESVIILAGIRTKQGEQQDDLTKQSGRPIKCDSAVLSLLDNGRVLFQVSEKKGKLTPLGFSRSGLDFDTNPNFITLPLQSVYLPHSTASGTPEKINGIEGFCFLDGKANLRVLTTATCVACYGVRT